MWNLRTGVTQLTGIIKSLRQSPPKQTVEQYGCQPQRAWRFFRRFHLQNRQNADEIDSAGDNLSVESDSQAYQRNQTNVLPATTTLKRKAALSEQTKKTNVSSLFMCVFSDRAIAFWTSPGVPGTVCEDKYFFTTGRSGTSPRSSACPASM